MPDLRIRIDLSDFVNGLNGMRWMYLSVDKVSMVADLVNVIREEYEEVKTEDCVNLFLDGFSLPSWEPIKILKDGDLVKGFLSKGNPNKRQASECDNERCSPKKRKKLDVKSQEVSGGGLNKLKSPKLVAGKKASPESKLQNVKEVVKKNKNQSSSSSSSSSSSEDEAIKKPSQEVIKNNAKKDSSTSSSSSSDDEKKPPAKDEKVETVTTKRPPAVSVKTTNISSSSDDSSSSSSSEDEQPTKQATPKKIPPVKSTLSQKKDSSSSSDSSSDSESDEPTKTQISNPPKTNQETKTNAAPTKPKRKRKRKNKNKNKLAASETAPAQHLPQISPSPAAWHKSKNSQPPQNNRIVFEDTPSETFTSEQIQELYKMSKPAKNMPSPRPDLLPKVNNFLRNAPEKTPIGPSLPSCEAAILSGQDEKANTNKAKPSPRIVFHPRVVTFTNGDSSNGDKAKVPVGASETDSYGGEGGFSSLLSSNGAMFVRNKKSAKRQQLNDVQTNVSVVITNPVNGEAGHENDSSTVVVNEEKKDYSVYHPVSEGGPRKGDIIAYKVVEISQNYTPELSEYKEGKVLEWDGTGKVTLELINKQIKKREGRFEVEGMTDDVSGEVVKEFSWSEIIEPRLIFP